MIWYRRFEVITLNCIEFDGDCYFYCFRCVYYSRFLVIFCVIWARCCRFLVNFADCWHCCRFSTLVFAAFSLFCSFSPLLCFGAGISRVFCSYFFVIVYVFLGALPGVVGLCTRCCCCFFHWPIKIDVISEIQLDLSPQLYSNPPW